MTEEEEPQVERIELGRDPRRHPSRQRAVAFAARLRSRLGAWFTPVVVLLAIVLVGASVFVVAETGGSGQDSAATQLSSDSGRPATDVTAVPSPAPSDDADQPDPLAALSSGRPPQVPYYSDGALHWNGGELLTDRRNVNLLVTRGGTSVLLTRSQRLVQLDESNLRPLGAAVTGGPAISSDGRTVAWVNARGSAGRLVLWDVVRRQLAAVAPIRLGFRCCDRPGVQVVGIDSAGRVYLTADGRVLLWSPPQRDLVPLRNISQYTSIAAVTADGPVFDMAVTAGQGAPLVYGVVSANGKFNPVDKLSTGDGSWSEYGDIVASVTSPATAIALPLDGLTTTLDTPPTMRVQNLTWESAARLLVVVTDDRGKASWLRCDAGTGRCELAADLGESGRFKKTWAVSTNDPLSYL